MKTELKFISEEMEDGAEMDRILNSHKAYRFISEIEHLLWRPYMKHGYHDKELEALNNTDIGDATIGKLRDLYYEIKEECEVPSDV